MNSIVSMGWTVCFLVHYSMWTLLRWQLNCYFKGYTNVKLCSKDVPRQWCYDVFRCDTMCWCFTSLEQKVTTKTQTMLWHVHDTIVVNLNARTVWYSFNIFSRYIINYNCSNKPCFYINQCNIHVLVFGDILQVFDCLYKLYLNK